MRPIRHTWEKVDDELREGKICSVCKKWLPLGAFSRCHATHDKLQLGCKSCQHEYHKKEYERDPKKRPKIAKKYKERRGPEYWQKRHLAFKQEVIDAYGGKCACCGETEIAFLSLDHIDGNGGIHRKRVGASNVWRDLRDLGYPKKGYRVLCMNCQFGYRFGKTCPHKLRPMVAMNREWAEYVIETANIAFGEGNGPTMPDYLADAVVAAIPEIADEYLLAMTYLAHQGGTT